MAPRWTAAGMIEAAKGFRRLKAWKQLPSLAASLKAIQSKTSRLRGVQYELIYPAANSAFRDLVC